MVSHSLRPWLPEIVLLSLAGGLLCLMLGGCQPAPVDDSFPPSIVSSPTPTVELPPVLNLTEAYSVEPLARRDAVLTAAGAFLNDADPQQSDESLSVEFTTQAFACNCLTLPMPGLIARQGQLAVVSLPEGLGLFLYDGDQPVLELSRWTADLMSMKVYWGEAELVVGYVTQGNDGVETVHALLAVNGCAGWQVVWSSNEEPGWWFNAIGGELAVGEDRHVLTVTGLAAETTQVFYEEESDDHRVFELNWQRTENTYRVIPPMPAVTDRRSWLWEVAQPSPYATLVEFIERLQIEDIEGAGTLVTDDNVLAAAVDFGLNLPQRRYQILSMEQSQIVFRDLQGTFVVDFVPPNASGKWLISNLQPPGRSDSTEN